MVGSVILFAFPRLDLGLFFSAYKLLIKGAMKITEIALPNKLIQPIIQAACIYRPGEIHIATPSVRWIK
jgi:hypothetical protein